MGTGQHDNHHSNCGHHHFRQGQLCPNILTDAGEGQRGGVHCDAPQYNAPLRRREEMLALTAGDVCAREVTDRNVQPHHLVQLQQRGTQEWQVT